MERTSSLPWSLGAVNLNPSEGLYRPYTNHTLQSIRPNSKTSKEGVGRLAASSGRVSAPMSECVNGPVITYYGFILAPRAAVAGRKDGNSLYR